MSQDKKVTKDTPAYRITIDIYPPKHPKAPCVVNGFPPVFGQAMNFMLMGVRFVADFFMQSALKGGVQIQEESRIIKSTNLPPSLFGKKKR